MAATAVNPESESKLTVRTISSDGKAPKLRVATPAAAYSAYVTQREIDRVRQARFAAIAGIYAGFPPTPPSEMARLGMADMPNINYKQFQAKVDAYCSNWNAITAGGSEWYEIEAEHENPMEAMRRSKCLTQKFNAALKKWDSTDFCNGNQYILESAIRDKQMALFDIGVAYFADGIDFRWRCIPTRKIIVPEGTRLTLDNCPALFIEDQMSVPDLWAMRNKDGWEAETIEALLYLRTNQTSRVTGVQETWGEWVERVRSNDNWLYSDWPPLNFVHIYVKEFTDNINKGKISHGIFCPDITFPSASEKNPPTTGTKTDISEANSRASTGWMYHDPNVAERWSQVLIAFADSSGPEGNWHSCKGYGDLIFDGCHLGNILLNQANTSAMIRGSLLFSSQSEGDKQKMSQFKWTRFGLLNPGIQIEQVRFEIDVQAGFDAFNLNTNIINQNSRNFPQNDTSSSGEQPTATQVNFDRADQAQFTGLQVDNYRSSGGDPLGSEMYRRIAQPASKYPEKWPGGHVAKWFRDECKKYGIPEGDLLKIKFVRMSRNRGTGNRGLDVMIGDQLLTVATPGEGQKNAQLFKATALVGSDFATAFVQTEMPDSNTEDWQISQENLNIQAGQVPQAFGYQEHMKHLGPGAPWGHITLTQELVQLATQWMDEGVQNRIEDSAALHGKIQAGIQHSGQHVDFLAQYRRNGKNPALHEEDVKQLRKLLNDFMQFNETFGESIQTAQEQQQPSPEQMDPKMLETQAKIERDNMLAEAKARRDDFVAGKKVERSQIQGAVKLEQSQASHQQKLGQQAETAAVDVQKRQLMDAQDIEKNATLAGLDIATTREKAAAQKTNGTTE